MNRLIRNVSVTIILLIVCSCFVLSQDALTAEKKQAIVDKVSELFMENYVFEDVAAQMTDLLKKKLADGDYNAINTIPEFVLELTKDLRSVSHDRHITIMQYVNRRPAGAQPDPEKARQEALIFNQKRNFAFKKAELLDGNVGYLDFRGFLDAKDAGPTAIAALNFLAYSDALIIDMRYNGGGSPTMIQLICSYFFDEPVHLNTFYIRKGDWKQQFWSHAKVEGPRMVDTPIFVLTSKRTFSAAEEFTYDLKHKKRATIVGEVTGGGAHPVRGHDLPELGVTAIIPFGRAINPDTQTNWEGKGVQPDILVDEELALDAAYAEALKVLMGKEEDEAKKLAYQAAIKGIEAKTKPVEPNKKDLEPYVGDYERGIRIWFEDGQLKGQTQGIVLTLVPYGDDFFFIKEMGDNISFMKDDDGKVTGLQILSFTGNPNVIRKVVR